MAQPLTDAINALTTYANSVTGASDQTLSEAVATLAAGYGGGGSHNLPSAYQEVTYLGVWNNCYFDLGTVSYTSPGFHISCLPSRRNNNYGPHVISADNFYLQFVIRSMDTLLRYKGDESTFSAVTIGYEVDADFNLSNDGALNIEWTLGTVTGSITEGTITSGHMYLFASGSVLTQTNFHFNGLVFELSIYDAGAMVHNYVPCYRKQDNVIGFYDIIGNSFITTIGSGTLTKGSDI